MQLKDGEVRTTAVIQTYNHEPYIAGALEGALEQRETGTYEVLVGDDCSSDGTRAIIESYARRYPAVIKTYFPERNLGSGGNALFVELARRARGRYVAIMDGDDYWTAPDKISRQAYHLDHHVECSMVFHNVLRVNQDASRKNELYNPPFQPKEVTTTDLLDFNPVAGCSPMFRRTLLNTLPPWYVDSPWGDWPLYFLAAAVGRIDYIPDVMGVYRVHSGGAYSGLSHLTQLQQEVAFFTYLSQVLPVEYEVARLRRLAVAQSDQARAHLELRQREQARRMLRFSYDTCPLDLRRLRLRSDEARRLALWLRARTPEPIWNLVRR